MRTAIPWLDKMCGEEDSSEQNAETTNNDVCNAQERVPPAHHSPGRDED